jgi:hypothetical protein
MDHASIPPSDEQCHDDDNDAIDTPPIAFSTQLRRPAGLTIGGFFICASALWAMKFITLLSSIGPLLRQG